ncbi:TIGR02302 family protein [Phreatobacter aquaticus]|uniref:TIGR02302 family protein n=1 Tax=Phreatobacter aquaticus TaxID=2570229 RepID=UPI00143D46F6|nr:TIGR02302 family protein [Phreatobacter aquaticus]
MSDGETPDRHSSDVQSNLALRHAQDRARLVLLWERIWPRLVLFLVIFGGVLAVSWLGFWQVVPYWARFGGVVFVLALLFLAAWPLLTIRRPTDAEALKRIDKATGGGHRPATALADDLATADDPFARALWAEHRARVVAATGRLKTGIPMPRMANLDRYAIRALAVLLIVPAFFLAGDERMSRLLTAFDWRAPPAPITYRVDAWVTPPAYTSRPPIILPTRRSSDTAERRDAAPDLFKVPAGSIVTLRVTGLANVEVKPEGGIAAAPIAEAANAAPPAAPTGLAETRWTISADGTLIVRGGGIEPLGWQFEALADRAPTIAFEREPQADQRNHLVFAYKVEDDYGVTSAEARFALAPSARALQRDGARALATLPAMPLVLPQARTRSGSGQTTRDFAAHPFAGLQVAVTLHAQDDAGNQAQSATVVTTLPQRSFSKPIPRALVEQRRILALDANARPRIARALDALTTAPDRFGMETPVYLGLRTAYYRTARARTDEQLTDVIDFLWDMAVRIEDGDVSEAERNAQQAAERLRQAIERGASNEEIQRLTQELRQAMDRLMRELTEQAQRNRQDNPNQRQAQRDQNQRNVRPQDLRDMLNRIENLARNGARDQAQRLMQELQQMLQGLQAGRQQQQQEMGEGGEQGENPQDQLSDMIRRQQQLRDQTFRRNQEQRRAQRGQQGQRPQQGQQRPGQRGQQGQQGEQQPGQGGEQGEGEQDYSQLGEGQRALRELLDQLREQLGQQGEGQGESEGGRQAQQGLGNAGRAMREAEEALGRGDGQGAADAQGRALRGLQQGAQGLAQQQQEGQGQQQGQGQQPGQPGRNGQAGNQDYDPLGRPTRGREPNENSNVRIPNAGEGAAQRAQRVLEELRRRLSDPDRPTLETDYIERLLRGLQIQ